MMLKSWLIQNFKPILDSGELKLAPVTVLAGRNSSGKSSLIQSILMISQTLSNRVIDRPLLPNGPIVQLGTFEDILSEQTNLQTLAVGFELSLAQNMQEDSVNASTQTNIQSAKFTVHFRKANSNSSKSAIEAAKVTIENILLEIKTIFNRRLDNQALFIQKDEDGMKLDFSLTIKQLSNSDLNNFLHGIESEYFNLIPDPQNSINYLGIFQTRSTFPHVRTPNPSLVDLSHFIPMRLVTKSSILDQESDQKIYNNALKTMGNIYSNDIERAAKQTNDFFASRIRYLGPLRVEPNLTAQKFAPSSELDDVGPRGEYAAMAYEANQNALIKWYNPQANSIEQGMLKLALNSWASYLGVANEIEVQKTGQSGVSWQIMPMKGTKLRSLYEVGTGVSQILPVLVMGLLAPENTLLLVEQPELHLHPAVQARLGDFFMGLAKCSKQCLIETHSENLVSQLRYHIVQAESPAKSDCLIYFVDQDEQGAAQFNPIEISPKGNILNWPDGFFDETMLQEDRITAASLKKKVK